MFLSKKERDKLIAKKVTEAPKRLKGRVVNRLEVSTGLSRSQIYRITEKVAKRDK